MKKQIINITDEQRQNLVNEIATLVSRFKKNEQVECIYFSPYKGLGKIKCNVFELTIVTKGISNEIMKWVIKYNEIHQDHDLLKKFGVKIHLIFDDERKYTSFPLNLSEIFRVNDLYNSEILFDKNGEYLKIKKEAQECVDIPNSGVFQYKKSAEIYSPVNSSIIKEKSREISTRKKIHRG